MIEVGKQRPRPHYVPPIPLPPPPIKHQTSYKELINLTLPTLPNIKSPTGTDGTHSPGTKFTSTVDLPPPKSKRRVVMKTRAPSPPPIEQYLHAPPMIAIPTTQEEDRFDIYEEVVNFGNIMEPRSGVLTLRKAV